MANKGVAANGLWENEGHSDDNQTDMYIATFREIGTLSNRLIAAAAVVRDWRPGQEPFSKYRSEIDGILDQIDELEARVYSKSAPRLRRKKVRDSDDGQFDARDDDYSYELSDLRATIAQAFDTARTRHEGWSREWPAACRRTTPSEYRLLAMRLSTRFRTTSAAPRRRK